MDEEILGEARRLADDVFRPNAEKADQGEITGQVGANVGALAKARYFGLGIAAEFGGYGADDTTRREFTETIASACGVTAFVQQQLHSGGNFVGMGQSEELKRELLPQFASGANLCGVAFSHLRRPGEPMVKASPADGGYRIDGIAPWITGWRILDSFILGATLPDGSHLYAYVPRLVGDPAMQAGAPIALAVMNASDTVEVTFTDYLVPQKHVLLIRSGDALQRADFCGITGHVYSPLGCARGSVHYLRTLAERRRQESLREAADQLMREVDHCRSEALQWSGACADLPEYKQNALHARASAIILAVRAAHAAVTATGGTAHLIGNAPQRLFREAMFYTTLAQTADVRAGTLDLLLSPECWSA